MAAMGASFQTTRNRARVGYPAILLVLLIAGLIGYKGLSGLGKLQQVRASGALELRDDILRTNHGPGDLEFLRRSVKYLQAVWPALLFGILIAAGVHDRALERTTRGKQTPFENKLRQLLPWH
jgi:hypothetical protein